MSIIQQVTFTVESQLQSLEQVLANLEQCYQPWISRQDWLGCQLILAEGFTNAVRHAHKNLAVENFVEINITLFSYEVEIKIWDYGEPFDLLQYSQKFSSSENFLSSGGRGLFLMQKIATHLSYDRLSDQRNCLVIVKQFSYSWANAILNYH